jgi:imidazolonepropionase
MSAVETVDALYVHARELVTLRDGPPTGSRRGADLAKLGVIEDGAVAVRGGRIVGVGKTDELTARFRSERTFDLSGLVVLPGFVDAHTHPVFAKTRQDEFHMRCQGADYLQIAQAGGGILNSARALRAASREDLAAVVRRNYDGFLANGTTTIEAKSGYGLSTDSELLSLEVLGEVAEEHPLTVARTFLGAHEVPEEYRADPDRYVDLVVDEMLPAVAERGLATSCDVFAEPKVFDAARSERILRAALDRGFRLRVHADEIEPMGGAELSARLGADSADHLPRISDEGIRALAASRTTAMLLPGTSFYLGKPAHAPARRMIEAGCAVALATDFNPGSCYTQSMTLVVTLACVLLHMTPEECITATTINAAASLGLDGEIGTLHDGKRCDLVALDLPDWRGIGYVFGGNPVAMTVKDGEPVCLNVHDLESEL